MASLTSCLKKAGTTISARDRAGILDRAQALRGEGVKAAAASRQAVAEAVERAREASKLAQSRDQRLLYKDDGARGSFSPSTSTITLLQGADLSTFLHEAGHFFLHVQADIAARIEVQVNGGADVSEGERQIVDDARAAMRWMGVEPSGDKGLLDTWHAMTVDQQREHHEKFARGFERYLFEGRAPSIEMRGAFGRFRAWLLNVYRHLSALNVKLDDEVRGIFDRMLATAEQIKDAEAEAALGLVFESPEQAASIGADFRGLHDMATEASQEAMARLDARQLGNLRWLDGAKSRHLKAMQADTAAARKEVEREVRAEVMATQVYRTWAFLTGKYDKVTPGVDVPDAVENSGRLRTQVLRDTYGTEADAVWRTLSDRRMTSPDGIHPEIVAELFGYQSADAMVQDLAAAESPDAVISRLTDQRTLERHGDLQDEEAMRRAVDEAVHNEMRTRVLSAELAALDSAVGPKRKGEAELMARAARDLAAKTIGETKVRDLRPTQFTAAAARAGRQARDFFAAGDTASAAAQKRTQLINHQAARAALEARGEVDKTKRRLLRLAKRPPGVDPAYADQIDQLLEAYALKDSPKDARRRASLAEWIEAQRAAGLEPDIDPALITNKRSIQDLTIDELRGLRDAVAQIEHLGRLKKRLLAAKEEKDFEASRDAITASIRDNAGGRQAVNRQAVTAPERAAAGARAFWASHFKAASLARIMDGGKDGGAVWERLIRPANEAGDAEATMLAGAAQALAKIVDPIRKQPGWRVRRHFPSIGRSLNGEERLALMLNLGNEGNAQRLLDGEGWTTEKIAPVLDAATSQEWQAVQAIWDHFESYRPQIAAKQRRVYGVEPEWIEPRPIVTPHGTLRGGYYPVRYDSKASVRAGEHEEAAAEVERLKAAYTSATTRRSYTKARAAEVKGRPLLLTLDALYTGTQEVIHDLAWHETLIDANRYLRSDAVASAIREHYGAEVHQELRHWVEDIAVGQSKLVRGGDEIARFMRRNVASAGLAFNLANAAIQPLGITQSISRVGGRWVGIGIAKYIGGAKSAAREARQRSEFMRNRQSTRFRELSEVRSQVRGQTAVGAWMTANSYRLMLAMQALVDVPTWHGAYAKAMASGVDESTAVALADQAVIDAQGSGQTKDLASVERGGEFQKLFTTFYGFFNTTFNLAAQSGMTRSKPRFAADMLLLIAVPAVLGAILKDALRAGGDDDDEELSKKLAGESISYLMGTMVGVRELAAAAQWATNTNQYGMGYQGPSGVRMLQDATKLGQQVGQGEFDDAFGRALVNVVGDFTGLPSAQINRTVQGVQAVAEGETQGPIESAQAIAFGFKN